MNPSPDDSGSSFKTGSQEDWKYTREGGKSDSSQGNLKRVQHNPNDRQEKPSSGHRISRRAGIVIDARQPGRDEPQSAQNVFSLVDGYGRRVTRVFSMACRPSFSFDNVHVNVASNIPLF